MRSKKIVEVLRLQDERAPFGPRMAALLADGDRAVRRRAALACGSLQDTAAIGPLMDALADSDRAVAEAAAFAIGQTAGRLPESKRERLALEIVRNRLGVARATGRLTEEIGKFCTASSLAALVAASGNVDTVHTAMAIARSAIRGVTSAAATSYCLECVRGPAPMHWQAAYALQRIGDTPETRNGIGAILPASAAPDPLVRLNVAALLGKLHGGDECTATLCGLASNDTDWRVRVNALKALALSPSGVRVNAVFMRAFEDRMVNVAVASLAAFPPQGFGAYDTSAAPLLALLRRISVNRGGLYAWQVQGEASAALARITHRAPWLPATPDRNLSPDIEAMLIRADGASCDTASAPLIRAAAASGDPRIACAALEALGALARRPGASPADADTAAALSLRALRSGDMAIVATAAGLLGDSLFRRVSSVPPLLEALRGLRPPDDVESIQDILDALRSITGRDYTADAPVAAPRSPSGEENALAGWTGGELRVALRTTRGDILIALDEDAAPYTVMSLLRLVHAGFFDGLTFHRVVPNFVVQGGDPRGDGWGGPGYTLRSEFSPVPYERGTVGIASAGKDTEGSQFFITHSPQPHLDGRYTVVGRVIRGMDAVDRLRVGDTIIDVRIAR